MWWKKSQHIALFLTGHCGRHNLSWNVFVRHWVMLSLLLQAVFSWRGLLDGVSSCHLWLPEQRDAIVFPWGGWCPESWNMIKTKKGWHFFQEQQNQSLCECTFHLLSFPLERPGHSEACVLANVHGVGEGSLSHQGPSGSQTCWPHWSSKHPHSQGCPSLLVSLLSPPILSGAAWLPISASPPSSALGSFLFRFMGTGEACLVSCAGWGWVSCVCVCPALPAAPSQAMCLDSHFFRRAFQCPRRPRGWD